MRTGDEGEAKRPATMTVPDQALAFLKNHLSSRYCLACLCKQADITSSDGTERIRKAWRTTWSVWISTGTCCGCGEEGPVANL